MKTKPPTTDLRGKSVYETLVEMGWKSMRSPHSMRDRDCFRKGSKRAFIAFEHAGTGDFYYAVEGIPSVDSFRQRYWKVGTPIAYDGNFPVASRALMEAVL